MTMEATKKSTGQATIKTVNDVIDFCEIQTTTCIFNDLSIYNISSMRYHGGFSLECIDVDDQYDEQKTCEWILRAKFIDT